MANPLGSTGEYFHGVDKAGEIGDVGAWRSGELFECEVCLLHGGKAVHRTRRLESLPSVLHRRDAFSESPKRRPIGFLALRELRVVLHRRLRAPLAERLTFALERNF